jgi:hypothetical protein
VLIVHGRSPDSLQVFLNRLRTAGTRFSGKENDRLWNGGGVGSAGVELQILGIAPLLREGPMMQAQLPGPLDPVHGSFQLTVA